MRWAVGHPDFYLVMFGAEAKRPDQLDLARAAEAAFSVLLDAIGAARSSDELVVDDREALAGSVRERGRITQTPTPTIGAIYAAAKLLGHVLETRHGRLEVGTI